MTVGVQNDKLAEDLQSLAMKQNQIYAKLNALLAGKREEGCTIDVLREREYYRDFPTCEEEMPGFREAFLALTAGLDEESIRTISLAIGRIRRIKSTTDRRLPLYTAREEREYREALEHLGGEVLRLSDGCYYYNGYMLPSPAFEPCVFMDKCGLGHLENPAAFAKKDIIDAGAFIGDSALIFSGLTNGKVYAFEPSGDNYALLQKTVEMNGLGNVVPCRMALGKERGQVELTKSIIPSANTQIKNKAVPYFGTETAKVARLDDFVRENGLDVGLIKVDIEGAEQLLLAGALETIRTMRPALLISIYHNADDFFRIKPFLEKLGLGYRFKVRHPAIGTVLTETMLIAEA